MLCGLLHELQPAVAPPSVAVAAEMLSRISINCHTICDADLQQVGVGLYPVAGLANHSCAPTAVQTFDGTRIVFRALEPLPPGAAVTIAYIELADGTAARAAALRASYLFECGCRRCVPPPPPDRAAAEARAADWLRRSRAAEMEAIDAAEWTVRTSRRAVTCRGSRMPFIRSHAVTCRYTPPSGRCARAPSSAPHREPTLPAWCQRPAGGAHQLQRTLQTLRTLRTLPVALIHSNGRYRRYGRYARCRWRSSTPTEVTDVTDVTDVAGGAHPLQPQL